MDQKDVVVLQRLQHARQRTALRGAVRCFTLCCVVSRCVASCRIAFPYGVNAV